MCTYFKAPFLAVIAFSLMSCSAVAYKPGEAPPLMCRGESALWRLAWRDNVQSNHWNVVGEFQWSEWVAGQQFRSPADELVTNRVRNWGPRSTLALYIEGDAGQESARLTVFREVRDCFYLDDSGLVALYARHTRRW